MANGFDRQAIPCLAEAQKLEPEQARWPYLHATVLLLFSQPREAVPLLYEALAVVRVPDDKAVILHALGTTLVEEGRLDDAESVLRKLEHLESDSPRTHAGLGLLAFSRGDKPSAREHLARVVEHPSARQTACSLLANLTSDDEAVSRDYRSRAERFPPDAPWPTSFSEEVRRRRYSGSPTMNNYFELLAAGRADEAIDALREIVAVLPSEEACFTLGNALIANGRFEEAERSLRQSLQFNPRNVRAHLILGIALFEQGDAVLQKFGGTQRALTLYTQAVVAEDDAIRLQQDLAIAHQFRGRALLSLCRTDEALAALREAVLVGPDLVEAQMTLGEALALEGYKKEALERLEDAVRVAKPMDTRPQELLDRWRPLLKP
jgi:tetratricopeptide (TPR) repeat protein